MQWYCQLRRTGKNDYCRTRRMGSVRRIGMESTALSAPDGGPAGSGIDRDRERTHGPHSGCGKDAGALAHGSAGREDIVDEQHFSRKCFSAGHIAARPAGSEVDTAGEIREPRIERERLLGSTVAPPQQRHHRQPVRPAEDRCDRLDLVPAAFFFEAGRNGTGTIGSPSNSARYISAANRANSTASRFWPYTLYLRSASRTTPSYRNTARFLANGNSVSRHREQNSCSEISGIPQHRQFRPRIGSSPDAQAEQTGTRPNVRLRSNGSGLPHRLQRSGTRKSEIVPMPVRTVSRSVPKTVSRFIPWNNIRGKRAGRFKPGRRTGTTRV